MTRQRKWTKACCTFLGLALATVTLTVAPLAGVASAGGATQYRVKGASPHCGFCWRPGHAGQRPSRL